MNDDGVCSRLWTLRTHTRLTDVELAVTVGLSHAWWHRLKKGTKPPSRSALKKVFRFFPHTEHWIMTGEHPGPDWELVRSVSNGVILRPQEDERIRRNLWDSIEGDRLVKAAKEGIRSLIKLHAFWPETGRDTINEIARLTGYLDGTALEYSSLRLREFRRDVGDQETAACVRRISLPVASDPRSPLPYPPAAPCSPKRASSRSLQRSSWEP